MTDLNESSVINVNEQPEMVAPLKFGGWPYVLSVGLIISILALVFTLISSAALLGEIDKRFNGMIITEIIFDVGFIIFMIFTATKFFARKREAPKLMQAVYIVSVVDAILSFLLLKAIAGHHPISDDAVVDIIKSVISAAIWVTYFNVSNRVKQTFLR